MPRDLFEFYCSKGNGGCGGYVVVPLQTDDARDVILVCPNCGHEHYRGMKDGEITERRHHTRVDNESVHRIEPTRAAFSWTSRAKELEEERGGFLASLWGRRGGEDN